jgi:hypothetical protein
MPNENSEGNSSSLLSRPITWNSNSNSNNTIADTMAPAHPWNIAGVVEGLVVVVWDFLY